MDIGLYEDWMKPQIAKLFSIQYGIKEEDFSKLIGNFYEHPFQKNKCIRIVAKEGVKIIGFQSFFYWPYTLNKEIFNSYQSGNSLVHPDYRGKGVFQKLLNYLDTHREEFKIDFIIGFPIDVSVGSLIRNKWQNILNLQWYIKMVSLFSFFFRLNKKKMNELFGNNNEIIIKTNDNSSFRIYDKQEFTDWRKTHYDKSSYYSFYFKKGEDEIVFKLKTNIRKKIIKELIIGDIMTTSYEDGFVVEAFNELYKKASQVRCISLLTIALNDQCDYNFKDKILKCGYKKINKQIYFCIKPFINNSQIQNKEKWILYRGDVDTW